MISGDITSVIALFAYLAIAALYIQRWKKGEKNPQDYIRTHILVIELWVISFFIMTVMRKVTILIAWQW